MPFLLTWVSGIEANHNLDIVLRSIADYSIRDHPAEKKEKKVVYLYFHRSKNFRYNTYPFMYQLHALLGYGVNPAGGFKHKHKLSAGAVKRSLTSPVKSLFFPLSARYARNCSPNTFTPQHPIPGTQSTGTIFTFFCFDQTAGSALMTSFYRRNICSPHGLARFGGGSR